MAPRLDATMESNSKVLRRSASSNMERGGSFSEADHQETVSDTKLIMPQTISLPLLNFVDMFAVSLVVPLLFQYYKSAGVTSANQRELLSSVYSSSQILGGVVLGAMTDARIIRRKTVLYLSFGGSAIAYAMIAFGGFSALIVSRVLVGLVKQTMTVTTSLMTKCTTEENRAKYMGRYVRISDAS
jgi:MFS family permease